MAVAANLVMVNLRRKRTNISIYDWYLGGSFVDHWFYPAYCSFDRLGMLPVSSSGCPAIPQFPMGSIAFGNDVPIVFLFTLGNERKSQYGE